jgi:hypothetical protein
MSDDFFDIVDTETELPTDRARRGQTSLIPELRDQDAGFPYVTYRVGVTWISRKLLSREAEGQAG